ncbi:MAG: hypothetical protein QM777_05060 [Pseudorhodoferax sp.]
MRARYVVGCDGARSPRAPAHGPARCVTWACASPGWCSTWCCERPWTCPTTPCSTATRAAP